MRPILYSKITDLINKIDVGKSPNSNRHLSHLIRRYLRESQYPIAAPKNPLKIKRLVEKTSLYIPTSLGADGYVYGVVENSNTIWRSNDGMETIDEVNYDFFSEGYYYPYWVTKTPTGFVVITGNRYGDRAFGGANVGAIFYSDVFESGYELKDTFTPNHTPSEFGITYYHGLAISEQIILVAERGFPSEGEEIGKIRGTFDGGKTWRIVKEFELVNPNVNAHFHTAVYDPYRGRIWASQGDLDNAKLFISDDLGDSWREIKLENDIGQTRFQPTMLLPLANNIAYGADGGPGGVGIMKIPVDKDFYGRKEHFSLVEGAFAWDQVPVYQNYPISNYAVRGNEAYISLPTTYGHRKSWVIATGDGGNTFHVVAGFNYGRVLRRGIIGPDENNNLYGVWDTEEEPNTTAIFDTIDWIYK